MFEVVTMDKGAARQAMDKGHGTGLVVIPKGFSSAALSTTP